MSDEDIREKFPIKTIPKIIGEPTYKAINKLMEGLYANASTIPTTLRGGRNGHIGLLVDTSVYENIATADYKRPTDPGPYEQHGTSNTSVAQANANPIYKEEMRIYELDDNVDAAPKQEIITAF